MDIKNLTTHVTSSAESRDLWLNFNEDGLHASISVAALAERNGHIIGRALKTWAAARIAEHDEKAIAEEDAREEAAENGQFGAGA